MFNICSGPKETARVSQIHGKEARRRWQRQHSYGKTPPCIHPIATIANASTMDPMVLMMVMQLTTR